MGLLLSYNHWVWPESAEWFWLIIIGSSALSAHFCLAKAMKLTEVTTIVTLDFLRLPLITFVGVFFYAESFELSLLIGGAMMVCANLLNASQYKLSLDSKVKNIFSR
jgi:drug/metabolite transporter (DMT)-like permease